MIGWVVSMALAAPGVEHPREEVARVCFVRTYRVIGMAVPYLIEADGRPIGKLGNRRYLCIDAEPGHYSFTVRGNFIAPDGASYIGDYRIQHYKAVQIEQGGTIAAWGGEVNWLRITQPADRFEVTPVEEQWVRKRAVRPARARQFIHPADEMLTTLEVSEEESMEVERIPDALNKRY